MSLKAVIVAAGMGTRLRPLTEDTPKCQVKVGHKTILEHQTKALKACGVTEFVIINGYLKEKLNPDGFNVYTNDDYEHNQVLESLFYAEKELTGNVIISYADLIYTPEIIGKLIEGQGDLKALVDLDWWQTYDGRDQNPFTDAELCTGTESRITAIGKRVADSWNCRSEYTGIVYLSENGIKKFTELYRELRDQFKQGRRANLAGVPFRKAYVTHLLQEMIIRGHDISPIEIRGGWVEIDTMMDYEKAVEVFG